MSAETSTARTRKRKPRSVGRPRKSGNSGNDSPAEEILKAASVLFSTKGYAGTTMAEIADTVGIRGPSLYYHFELKSEILRAVSFVGIGGTVAIGDKLVQESRLSPAARLYQMIYASVLHLRSSKYELNCLFDPVFQEKEFKDLNLLIVSWLKSLARLLREGVEAEQLLIEDIELTADSIRGMLAAGINKQTRHSHLGHDVVARHIADFTLKAVLKKKAMLKSIHKQVEAYNATETAYDQFQV